MALTIHLAKQRSDEEKPMCTCDGKRMTFSEVNKSGKKGIKRFYVYTATDGRGYTYMPEYVTCEICLSAKEK